MYFVAIYQRKRIKLFFNIYWNIIVRINFANSYTLKSHIATKHTRNLPFKCRRPNCSKRFAIKGQRVQHEIKFHSEKREICTKCGKIVKDLIGHIGQLHYNESGIEISSENNSQNSPQKQETFECDFCGKKFYSIQEKENHEKTHFA